MSQNNFDNEHIILVEDFHKFFKNFLITFKNNCKKVANSNNYKNGYLHFYVFLSCNQDNKFKFLSIYNTETHISNNCITEELLFNQSQNAMIKIEFKLKINDNFDKSIVDKIKPDIKFINSYNNIEFFKNYIKYKSDEFYSVDYYIDEYIRIINFIDSNKFNQLLLLLHK